MIKTGQLNPWELFCPQIILPFLTPFCRQRGVSSRFSPGRMFLGRKRGLGSLFARVNKLAG